MSLVIFILLGSGCSTQTFHFKERNDGEVAKFDRSSHFFVNGIGQEDDIDPIVVCNGLDNVSKVEVEQTFLNGLIGAVTYGIYTPRTKRVYCVE